MRVFVDNTGLHAVYRCLEGRAIGEVDVLGLLQFATQIVFCDEILVGAYEVSEVRERTRGFLTELGAIGIDGPVSQRTCSPDEWVRGCMEVGLDFAEDFEHLIPDHACAFAGTAPDASNGARSADHGLHELIAFDHGESELEVRAAAALERHGAGIVEYTFAACPSLWQTARRAFQKRGGWPQEVSDHLSVLLRIYGNDFGASQFDAQYAPAVARSRLLRRGSELVYERLAATVADAASKLSSGRLPVPSVSNVLAVRSKGDPRGVLMEACRLRESASALRSVLRELKIKPGCNETDDALKIAHRLKEISTYVEAELGIVDAPKFTDALQISFILGIPAIGLDAVRLMDWFRHRWNRRRVAVLTDLSKAAAFQGDATREYRRLLRSTMGD
jgi:hypothetical protein